MLLIAGTIFMLPVILFALIWVLRPLITRLMSSETTHYSYAVAPKWPLAVFIVVGTVLLVLGFTTGSVPKSHT